MARIELHDNITLKGARRIMTRRGAGFRITLRNGRLYTFRKFHCSQPNSTAQLQCREILIKANQLAKDDLLLPGRREYWQNLAAKTGYKTALGCARAHFIALLKAPSHTAPRKSSPSKPRPRRLILSSSATPSASSSSRHMMPTINIWRARRSLHSQHLCPNRAEGSHP